MVDALPAEAVGRLLLTLILLVGALLAVRRWARRGTGPQHGVRVLARAGLARGALVAVVEVGDRRFLVGAGEHGVQLLSELDPAAEPVGSSPPVPHAVTERPHPQPLRPWSGLADQLRRMTVRTALQEPLHARRR